MSARFTFGFFFFGGIAEVDGVSREVYRFLDSREMRVKIRELIKRSFSALTTNSLLSSSLPTSFDIWTKRQLV